MLSTMQVAFAGDMAKLRAESQGKRDDDAIDALDGCLARNTIPDQHVMSEVCRIVVRRGQQDRYGK